MSVGALPPIRAQREARGAFYVTVGNYMLQICMHKPGSIRNNILAWTEENPRSTDRLLGIHSSDFCQTSFVFFGLPQS